MGSKVRTRTECPICAKFSRPALKNFSAPLRGKDGPWSPSQLGHCPVKRTGPFGKIHSRTFKQFLAQKNSPLYTATQIITDSGVVGLSSKTSFVAKTFSREFPGSIFRITVLGVCPIQQTELASILAALMRCGPSRPGNCEHDPPPAPVVALTGFFQTSGIECQCRSLSDHPCSHSSRRDVPLLVQYLHRSGVPYRDIRL